LTTEETNFLSNHKGLVYGMAALMVFGAFSLLIWAGTQRNQESWDTPMYHRDARAPNICLCYWMRSAFRVPCEDVPPALLKDPQ
jgi:hypothetical protein